MLFLRSLLHTVWMALTVIPYTLGVLLARVLGLPLAARWRVARAWLLLSVDSARWFCGVRYRVQGLDNLPTDPHQGVVLLVKHQSTYETFLLPNILPRRMAYVFKKELLGIPFFGWSIGSLDMIHIDRKDGIRAFHKVVEQGKRLLGQGTWVAMFPEGTRVRRGQVGEYKSGAARLAIMCGVPVVPVAVTSARCWPRNGFVRRPGVVEVSIGAPIATTGRKHEELTAEVQQWIEAEMRRLDPEAYPAPVAAPAPTPDVSA
ncbi:MAG: lysophospholipid acyltransferase family protein [Comamonas sp.]|nr:lysophospholipid acyltransferase family protein [Comamonas sp.]